MFDLKGIRMGALRPEDNGGQKAISRADLVQMLQGMGHRIHETQVARYEDSSNDVSYPLLRDWLRCLGTSIEQEEATSKVSKPLDVGSPYQELHQRLKLLSEHVLYAPTVDGVLYEEAHCLANATPPVPTVANIKLLIDSLKVKPNIVLSGRFDSGKSTLANHLNGENILPTGYQPITRVVTYVRHIDDRPLWLKSEKVLILKSGFDPAQWDNEQHVLAVQEEAGDYSLLQEYGAHDGEKSEVSVEAAMVFMDSPILKACNIVDLPGFSNDDRDSKLADTASKSIDALIYLSPFAGFLNGQDTELLKSLITTLKTIESDCSDAPTLSNLIIVASHADFSKSDIDITQAFDRAAKRLHRNLGSIWEQRSAITGKEISPDILRECMVPFWREAPNRREQLETRIFNLLSIFIPSGQFLKFNELVASFKNSADRRLTSSTRAFQSYLDNFDDMKVRMDKQIKDEPKRREKMAVLQYAASGKLGELQVKHHSAVKLACQEWFNAEKIESAIRSSFDDKKDAQQHISTFIINKIEGLSSQFIQSHQEEITEAINSVLRGYEEKIEFGNSDFKIDIEFDTKAAFLGGIAGMGTIGALAVWASSLGNLGGYIIAAKGVSVLSVLGISVGGTAAAASFLAAIGGPITLAIAAGILGALLVFSLFGQSWEARLAKKAAEDIRKHKLEERLLVAIDAYWKYTHKAFLEGLSAVEAQYQEQMNRLHKSLSNHVETIEEAEKSIKLLEEVRHFFIGIPWVPLSLPMK